MPVITCVIPTLRKPRQEDQAIKYSQFQTAMEYIGRACCPPSPMPKKITNKKKQKEQLQRA